MGRFAEPLTSKFVNKCTGEPPDSGGHSESGVGSQLWPPDFFVLSTS